MNAELFNNMERELLIAAFHKTTSLLPSPSLEKASQFCFYISHPQGRTIPTSPCAHLHHQPCLNISKSYQLSLPRKRTALPSTHHSPRSFNHVSTKSPPGRSGDTGKISPCQTSPSSHSPGRRAEHQGCALLNLHLGGSAPCPLEDPSAAVPDLSTSAIHWT